MTQSAYFYNMTGIYNYNQTTGAINDINSRFWNKTQSLNSSEIQTSFLNKSGDTMNGNLNFSTGINITMNGNKIYSNITCLIITGTSATFNVC
jgi:hypothetical protein